MTRLRRQALRLVAEDPELDRRFRLMLTATGIGEISALQILGELAVLPQTLDARQWVVDAGGKRSHFRRFRSGPVSHLRMVQREPRLARTQ